MHCRHGNRPSEGYHSAAAAPAGSAARTVKSTYWLIVFFVRIWLDNVFDQIFQDAANTIIDG